MNLIKDVKNAIKTNTNPTTGCISEVGLNIIRGYIAPNDYIQSLSMNSYDAILVSAIEPEVGKSFFGNIFFDMINTGNHPFPDGELIHTSKVKNIALLKNGLKLIHTSNTTYLVI